eukprot:CCRYP_011462-RA/>CCRYP_011462-RA protein AED:0.46 eAED:0.46 QI:0/0/0/1/0/0/2/0/88
MEITNLTFRSSTTGCALTRYFPFIFVQVIQFKFKRKTHLYIGPLIAGVTQIQYCALDGNNRCITMMTVEMDRIPYSDAFAVEVHWSAR